MISASKILNIEMFKKERREALLDVLINDDLQKLREFNLKHANIPYPDNEEIIKAAAYKTIQQLNDFSAEEKKLAAEKCIKLGFNPYSIREG